MVANKDCKTCAKYAENGRCMLASAMEIEQCIYNHLLYYVKRPKVKDTKR